jgi:DNA-binding NarL/FixJ family response regulator
MSTTFIPTLTIAIISRHHLAWSGLQHTFKSCTARRFVVRHYRRVTPDLRPPDDHPDVFILDIETEPNAVAAIRWIRESAPTSKILLLSGFEDRDRVHEAFDCGVDGVLLKIQPPEVVLVLIDTLFPSLSNHPRGAQDPGAVTNPMQALLARTSVDRQQAVWPEGLTERERAVIKLLRQGLSNKDIAHALCISDSTVRHHLTNIFDKVGVPNRQKLLVHAQTIQSSSD